MKQRLDLFYRGGRSYVQGSLIASTACHWLSDASGQAPVSLERIRFKRISQGHLVLSDQSPSKEEALGDIVVHQNGERLRFFLAEIQDEELSRYEDDASRLLDYGFDGALCCHSTAQPPSNLDDLLSAIVETVKQCVGETYPGASDIWFIGLQDGAISTHGAAYDGKPVEIIAEHGMENDQGERRLTRHAIRLVTASGETWTANIIFACRLPAKG